MIRFFRSDDAVDPNVASSSEAEAPPQVGKDDFFLLLGVCMEALSSNRCVELTRDILKI